MTREAQHAALSAATACKGDIVKIDLHLVPEDGMILEPLFDTAGRISFVLGGGNYLPGLHEVIDGMKVGASRRGVSIDGGWGTHNPDLVIDVPISNLRKLKNTDSFKVGSTLDLKHDIRVTVTKVSEDIVTVDANHQLAGCGYKCDVEVLDICKHPSSKLLYQPGALVEGEEKSPFSVATFAMGCFWGGELAFMRTPGVVGTRVGYTQGKKVNPTYEEVCNGNTKHREAILVTFDETVVTYEELINIFFERLAATQNQYALNTLFEEEDTDSIQYRHGVYFHDDHQREEAGSAIQENNNKFKVELLQATTFYEAEEMHQQYLLKGGQSARKGCKENIRCFG